MKLSSATRSRFIELVVSVAAVHLLAIGAYYAFDVQRRSVGFQRVFAWIWMGLTVAVVLVGLQRLKRARRTARLAATETRSDSGASGR